MKFRDAGCRDCRELTSGDCGQHGETVIRYTPEPMTPPAPRAGWLARQIANSDRNVDEWPVWMRREAGIPNPEDNALNRARTALAEIVEAAKPFLLRGVGDAVTVFYGDRPATNREAWDGLKLILEAVTHAAASREAN